MKSNLAQAAGQRLRDDFLLSDAPASYASLRQDLVLRAQADRLRRARGRRLAMVSACLAAAVLIWFTGRSALQLREAPQLAFSAGEASEVGRVGAYYTASADTPLALKFADGSNILVERRGGLRLSSAQRAKVSVQLETGAANFDVVPRRDSQWEIWAGPYLIRVTGTSFWVSWDVGAQALDLRMRAGAVVVTGPGIESGQRVRGTERFLTQVTATRSSGAVLEPSSASEAPRAPAPAAAVRAPSSADESAHSRQKLEKPTAQLEEPSLRSRASAPGADSSSPSADASPRTDASATPSLRPRDPSADVAAVERAGVEQVLATAGAEQLLSLADAARYSRRSDLARRALGAVRARFAGSPGAASAAFLLGRMADDGGRLQEAIGWYDTHARESGALVPEALGRKMLALHRLGHTAQRNRVASEYLERFPTGTYSRQAKALLSH